VWRAWPRASARDEARARCARTRRRLFARRAAKVSPSKRVRARVRPDEAPDKRRARRLLSRGSGTQAGGPNGGRSDLRAAGRSGRVRTQYVAGMGEEPPARSYGRVFDEVATEYDRSRPTYPDELVAHACQIAQIGSGDRVLEVGCGSGQLTQHVGSLLGAFISRRSSPGST